jgi:flagellar hook-associated protein 1 FlgK
MSLNTITSTAATGMFAAQTGLNTVSDNIANLNTPGYVRKIVDLNNQVFQGVGTGVAATGVTRAANQFLQNASLAASGGSGQAGVVSDMLTQAQSLFGDPSSTTSYFNQLNQISTDFQAAANDPASSLSSIQVVNDVSNFLSQSQNISASLSGLVGQADARVTNDIDQANQLLSQIDTLNRQITTTTAMGADATNSQNAQSELINQLSSLMDIKVQTTATGGVNVTSQSGVTLVGQGGAATLAYQASGTAASQVTVTQPGGAQQPVNLQLASGELAGLISLRNTQLPGVQDQLSEYVTQAVNALNQAHNASSSVPPPAVMTGQNIGLDLPTAVSGFSGKTTIAVVNTAGQLQQRVDIDFTAGTMSVNGGPAAGFTPATFLTSLNTALSPGGTASFNNGVLSLQASVPGTGLSIADDPTTPSSRVGQGFSQYFGLNNLVSSNTITNYQTGLKATDPSGYPAGQTITLRVSDGTGSQITDVTVTTPAGGTVQNLVTALNASSGGVGLYGQFTLDSSGGLTFAPNTPGGASISVVTDKTSRGVGGPSISQLFGIGDQQRASRTDSFSVRADIAAAPNKISFATLDLAAGAGQPVLAIGDGSGALKLAQAGVSVLNFDAAGGLAATSTTINQYAAQFAGALGNKAAAAASASTNAQAVQTEADSRRQSVEGVNLDQELVSLTTYQQAYNASARLVTASQDMFTTLLKMTGG